jgi:hypothetical protein
MPFLVTAFLVVSAIAVALMGFVYLVVSVVLNRFSEPVFPLPQGVTCRCNSMGCRNPATRGLKEVVEGLTEKGEYLYLSGEKVGVYCGKHGRTFSDQHPKIRILITAVVWVCLVLVSSFLVTRGA